MRTTCKFFGIALLGGVLLIPGLSATAADNLIKNGGFETWTGARPKDWTFIEAGAKPDGTCAKDLAQKYSGEQSLRYTDAPTGVALKQTVPVKGGEVYRFLMQSQAQHSRRLAFPYRLPMEGNRR